MSKQRGSGSSTAVDTHELAAQLRASVLRLARRLRQQDTTMFGPTVTAALATISLRDGITHGELAAVEQVTPPTISAVVGKLEDHGLIARVTDEQDRRITRLFITDAGRAQMDELRQRRTEWLDTQLHALDDEQRQRLADAIDVLQELTAIPEEPAP